MDVCSENLKILHKTLIKEQIDKISIVIIYQGKLENVIKEIVCSKINCTTQIIGI